MEDYKLRKLNVLIKMTSDTGKVVENTFINRMLIEVQNHIKEEYEFNRIQIETPTSEVDKDFIRMKLGNQLHKIKEIITDVARSEHELAKTFALNHVRHDHDDDYNLHISRMHSHAELILTEQAVKIEDKFNQDIKPLNDKI
tara:strand:- start:9533 stop:9958 length:426 start_codon:yes stop_codon:yes gene_type:complete